jgi:orotate phosphoribosyltransferase
MEAGVNADDRSRLLDMLHRHSFRRTRVVLASGKESDFFIDCKQTVLLAEGHVLAGRVMFDALDEFPECTAVAGVELGGCPLASAVSLTSHLYGRPLDAIYVRKAAKDHGSKRLIEGEVPAEAEVVILEDVVTTGGSTLRAVEHLKLAGLRVAGVVALVDRLEGGRQAIEDAGLKLSAIYTRNDFIPA